LSYSKPFGLLPKDLALIGVLALQSRATLFQSDDTMCGSIIMPKQRTPSLAIYELTNSSILC